MAAATLPVAGASSVDEEGGAPVVAAARLTDDDALELDEPPELVEVPGVAAPAAAANCAPASVALEPPSSPRNVRVCAAATMKFGSSPISPRRLVLAPSASVLLSVAAGKAPEADAEPAEGIELLQRA